MSQSQRQRTFIVYELRKPNGEVFYVGKGNSKRERLRDHLNEAQRLEEGKPVRNRIKAGIIRGIQRAGAEIQYHVVFESQIEFDAFEKEKCLINKYGRIVDSNGTLSNLTLGGEGACGWSPSEETRLKMSEASLGRKHSKETKQKMSEIAKQRKHSDETKQKISQKSKGRKLSSDHIQKLVESRKTNSPETREKMSRTKLGKKRPYTSPEARANLSKAIKEAWARRKGETL